MTQEGVVVMFSNVGPFILIWETLAVAVAGVLRMTSGTASADHLAMAAAISVVPALYATWELDRRVLDRAGRDVSIGEGDGVREGARSTPMQQAGRQQQRTA